MSAGRQRGGAISLLLTLVAIGLLAYFALRGNAKSPTAPGAPVDCERRIGALVQQTGGIGPAAQAAWQALPAECRKLMPEPAALAPSAERAPGT